MRSERDNVVQSKPVDFINFGGVNCSVLYEMRSSMMVFSV
ncbi:hypothetical protein P689_122289 [Candidatus Riesia pediculischaeffi PTSU]|uniref:Uncharacterized protein n=1 Tax=Candidatus Riesia pediculischaeffi PTSU TaxID=1401651 RepID=A0A0C1RZU2_9ENTR|nr:hypothetical protein P689_122289 [Candidatus Riesia pediculischaeffi PTSU]